MAPDPSCVLRLNLDENQGTVAKDTSDLSNDGTIYGASWADGKLGRALNFDGTTNKVVIASNAMISETAGSVSLWVKFNAVDKDQIILISGEIDADGESGKNQILIMLQGVDNRIKAGWQTIGESDWVLSPGALVIDAWYNLVLMWSLSENKVKIYIDTILRTGDVFTNDFKTNWEDELRLGRSMENGANVNPLDGIIDEVRIYNRLLSTDEVKAQYEQVMFWGLEEPPRIITRSRKENAARDYASHRNPILPGIKEKYRKK